MMVEIDDMMCKDNSLAVSKGLGIQFVAQKSPSPEPTYSSSSSLPYAERSFRTAAFAVKPAGNEDGIVTTGDSGDSQKEALLDCIARLQHVQNSYSAFNEAQDEAVEALRHEMISFEEVHLYNQEDVALLESARKLVDGDAIATAVGLTSSFDGDHHEHIAQKWF